MGSENGRMLIRGKFTNRAFPLVYLRIICISNIKSDRILCVIKMAVAVVMVVIVVG